MPLSSLPSLPAIHFTFALSSSFLLGVLGLFGLFYIIMSAVLFYHWITYGMGSHGIHVGEVLFFAVSIFVFAVAFFSASYF